MVSCSTLLETSEALKKHVTEKAIPITLTKYFVQFWWNSKQSPTF